jgi:hypothetical protein
MTDNINKKCFRQHVDNCFLGVRPPLEPAMANAIICCPTGTFVKTPLMNAVQKKKPFNTLQKNVPLLYFNKVSPNFIYLQKTSSIGYNKLKTYL